MSTSFSFQTFPVETELFLRENEKGIYRTSVYFLAKSLVGVICLVLLFFHRVFPVKWENS